MSLRIRRSFRSTARGRAQEREREREREQEREQEQVLEQERDPRRALEPRQNLIQRLMLCSRQSRQRVRVLPVRAPRRLVPSLWERRWSHYPRWPFRSLELPRQSENR